MKIVLVHGAWHDGSLWSDVAGPLKTGGHEVYTPTLAGNRPGSIDRTIGHAEAVQSAVDYIAEAVQSAVDYINKNNLSDIVLLGHSCGGSIISKIAEAMPERIRRLVYRNAFVLMDGESVKSVNPPPCKNMMDGIAASGAYGPGDFAWVPRFPARLGLCRLMQIPGSYEACFTNPTLLAQKIFEATRD